MTSPLLLNTQQQMWVSVWVYLLWKDVPCGSRFATLKIPHYWMAMSAEYWSKFEALYRKLWRLHMSKKSRVGRTPPPPLKKIQHSRVGIRLKIVKDIRNRCFQKELTKFRRHILWGFKNRSLLSQLSWKNKDYSQLKGHECKHRLNVANSYRKLLQFLKDTFFSSKKITNKLLI